MRKYMVTTEDQSKVPAGSTATSSYDSTGTFAANGTAIAEALSNFDGTVTSIGITQGNGIAVTGGPITSSGNITVAHADTSSQASSTNTGRVYIQSITLDDFGHVTNISTNTASDTTYEDATQTASGLMSSADKTKLDMFGFVEE